MILKKALAIASLLAAQPLWASGLELPGSLTQDSSSSYKAHALASMLVKNSDRPNQSQQVIVASQGAQRVLQRGGHLGRASQRFLNRRLDRLRLQQSLEHFWSDLSVDASLYGVNIERALNQKHYQKQYYYKSFELRKITFEQIKKEIAQKKFHKNHRFFRQFS